MKLRYCNIEHCDGLMRPTRDMHIYAHGGASAHLRMFRCTECDNRMPWVAKPVLNGTHAELHNVGTGYCVTSMLSDPMMGFKDDINIKKRRRRSRVRK